MNLNFYLIQEKVTKLNKIKGVYFDHDQQQWTDSVQGRLLECPLLAGIEWDLPESQGRVSGRECQLLKLEWASSKATCEDVAACQVWPRIWNPRKSFLVARRGDSRLKIKESSKSEKEELLFSITENFTTFVPHVMFLFKITTSTRHVLASFFDFKIDS